MADFLRIVGSAIFLVFFFGFCIFIHELGHFLAAKMRGLHIIAFSLGFRKFWSKKINGVEYRLGYLPFGGYVELPQIDSTGVPKDENGNELPEAKPVDRIITAAAGPLFNILFGLTLGCLVWVFGVPQDTPKMNAVTVAQVDKTGPEYAAGLREGDKIVKLNGRSFYGSWSEFAKDVMLTVGAVKLDIDSPEKKQVAYTPKPGSPYAPENLNREKIAFPYFLPVIPITLYPESNSPAAKAGLKKGDIVLSINDKPLDGIYEFNSLLMTNGDKPLKLKIRRGDNIMEINDVKPELDKVQPVKPRHLIGITYSTTAPYKITDIVDDYPAKNAGLQVNDIILSVNGKPLSDTNTIFSFADAGKEFTLEVERDGKKQEITVTPKLVKYYTLGVELAATNYPNPFRQFYDTIDLSYKSVRSIFFGVAKKLGLTESGSTIGLRNLSGPVGIGTVLFTSVYKGSFMHGIYFVVIVTFALAIFNLLPLPVLDGGHCLIAVLEIIFKRKIPDFIIKYISMTFIVLLVGLMVYVTFMDIQRLIPTKYLPGSEPKTEVKETPNEPAAADPANPAK